MNKETKQRKSIIKVTGGFWKSLQATANNRTLSFKLKVWMSSLILSNAKDVLVLFQELVTEWACQNIGAAWEFSQAVIGLNPTSWIDFPPAKGGLGCTHTQPPKASFAPANEAKAFSTHLKRGIGWHRVIPVSTRWYHQLLPTSLYLVLAFLIIQTASESRV